MYGLEQLMEVIENFIVIATVDLITKWIRKVIFSKEKLGFSKDFSNQKIPFPFFGPGSPFKSVYNPVTKYLD